MQITITGPRGCGKTTVAGMIARMLRLMGQNVRVVGWNDAETKQLREARDDDNTPPPLARCGEITIVDSMDGEDEFSIRMRDAIGGKRGK